MTMPSTIKKKHSILLHGPSSNVVLTCTSDRCWMTMPNDVNPVEAWRSCSLSRLSSLVRDSHNAPSRWISLVNSAWLGTWPAGPEPTLDRYPDTGDEAPRAAEPGAPFLASPGNAENGHFVVGPTSADGTDRSHEGRCVVKPRGI